MWDRQAAMLAVKGGQERTVYLWGVPPDSPMVAPRLVAGRQLLPEDGLAIVLNQRIAQEEGITIGDVITLTIGDRESAWTVAGLMLNVNNNQLDNYTPFEALQREAGVANRGATVAVKLMPEAADRQHDVMLDLRTALVSRGVEVSYLDSANDLRARAQSQFSILVALLLAMSLLAALVGSVGLAGTLSISVVERSREIGVMRAIGATSWAIVRIVAGEGILLAILSWLIAVPLSIPSARRFGEIIGLELLDAPLDFRYTADGALIWLGIILILSALASLLPAQRAARISVREALAYE
jgi:putative ABC transport system permease protein